MKKRVNIMLTPESVAALRALFDALGIHGQRADANLQPGIQRLGDWCREVGPETAAPSLAAAMSVSAAAVSEVGEMTKNDTVAKIRSFSQLRQGWHYREGFPITDSAITRAVMLCESLNGHEMEAFPTVDGGVLLVVYPTEQQAVMFYVTADATEPIGAEIEAMAAVSEGQ